jgi:hypothetical protein
VERMVDTIVEAGSCVVRVSVVPASVVVVVTIAPGRVIVDKIVLTLVDTKV